MKISHKHSLILIILSIIMYSNNLYAKCFGESPTWSTASLNPIDIQDCIDIAAEGDTIQLPSGEYVFENIEGNCGSGTTPCVTINKGVTVRGQGIGKTIIVDNTDINYNQIPFKIVASNARISNIEFNGPQLAKDFKGVIFVQGAIKGWRIDHCEFSELDGNGSGRAINVDTTLFENSVIDHNTFTVTTDGTFSAILVHPSNTVGDDMWVQKWDGPGSNDYLFIESNNFNFKYKNDSALQAGNGCRIVIRNNEIIGTGIDAHGAGSSNRAVRIYEIYNNTFDKSGAGGTVRAISLRGGTHIIHNNAMDNYPTPIIAQTYRPCFGAPGFEAWNNTFYITNRSTCDGTQAIDENKDSNGYSCKDQIGLISGSPGNQTHSPVYEWNNETSSGGDIDISVPTYAQCASMPNFIKEGRDYYNDKPKPDYTAFQFPHPLTTDTSDNSGLAAKTPTGFREK